MPGIESVGAHWAHAHAYFTSHWPLLAALTCEAPLKAKQSCISGNCLSNTSKQYSRMIYCKGASSLLYCWARACCMCPLPSGGGREEFDIDSTLLMLMLLPGFFLHRVRMLSSIVHCSREDSSVISDMESALPSGFLALPARLLHCSCSSGDAKDFSLLYFGIRIAFSNVLLCSKPIAWLSKAIWSRARLI